MVSCIPRALSLFFLPLARPGIQLHSIRSFCAPSFSPSPPPPPSFLWVTLALPLPACTSSGGWTSSPSSFFFLRPVFFWASKLVKRLGSDRSRFHLPSARPAFFSRSVKRSLSSQDIGMCACARMRVFLEESFLAVFMIWIIKFVWKAGCVWRLGVGFGSKLWFKRFFSSTIYWILKWIIWIIK